MLTQDEINVALQRSRKISARIQLLNYNFQVVDELSGVTVSTPSFKVDSTSDIRRTLSISLQVTDSSFDIGEGNKIWLDKYIKVYLAIYNVQTGDYTWTNMGIYMINNPSRNYTASTNVLSITCVDLMAKLTGLRNGSLEGITYSIPQGTNVRTAIIGTLALAGFTNYIVEECSIDVPNDINISMGGTVYDILKALRDILPQYQIYFDVDGVFHYELIPSTANAQVMVDDTMWNTLLIDYNIDTNFDEVKNVIEVHGKTHDIQYYNVATISGTTYLLTITGVSSLYNHLKIGFTAPSQIINPYIDLNGFGAKPLYDEFGNFAVLESASNVYYVAKYQASGDYFLFMGTVSPVAIAEELNPDSPFYVNGTLGRIRMVLSGGEYDNIYMTSLAQARADWELYNRCRVQDSITLKTVPIYWLDVNWVVEITLPNKQGTEVTEKYIIKQISTTFGSTGTQVINMMKYYPFYDE